MGDVVPAPPGVSESHHRAASSEVALLHPSPLVDGGLRVAVRLSEHWQVGPGGQTLGWRTTSFNCHHQSSLGISQLLSGQCLR